MKTFDEVLNELFRDKYEQILNRSYSAGKVGVCKDFWLGGSVIIWNTDYTSKEQWRSRCNHVLGLKYQESKQVLKPYRGKDIGEPVVKICKRILEKPYRFCSLKNQEQVTERIGSAFHFNIVELLPEIKILLDKDTQVKFVLKDGYIANLSYLTRGEQHLLGACIEEWYDSNRKLLEHKKQIREQKRKDKYRQEMVDQYKDL